MPVSSALSAGDITNLAGVSTLTRYLSVVPDTQVATARVNQASFTYPITQLTVDNTSANWNLVREGQTVYVGSTSGGKERGVYRVRKAGNSTTLYLQEMGSQDAGQQAVDMRQASIADNDYITVMQRWDVWSVLPRIDTATGLIYEDYDLTPGTLNTTPPPLVYVTVNNRRNHLFAYTTASTLAITASASVTKWLTSGSSTLSYSWSVPASWTGVSGSSTATLTATAAPGNYILRLTVTDSVGGAVERVIVVNIHHPTLNAPITISDMPRSDTRDRQGRRMSFSLNDSKITSLIDGAMVGYFEVPTWNSADVTSATRQFVGWVQKRDAEASEGLRTASVDIVSPAHLLTMLNSTSQLLQSTASPTTWQQVVPDLSSLSFVIWYMLRWRVANLLRLFNLTVLSVDPAGQRIPGWRIDRGSVYQQIQQLMTERGNFGCNSEGEFFALYHPSMQSSADRAGVVTRDALDASIYASANLNREIYPRSQQVRGEGFSWDGSATTPTPYFSDAPKVPGQGSGQSKLASQVVTDQDELNELTGFHYARLNAPYPSVSVSIQRNRDVYEPAELPFVELVVPDYLNPDNVEFNSRGVPVSVNKRHNPDGTSDIDLTLEIETAGLPGDYVPVPPPLDNLFMPVDFAPISFDPIEFPSFGEIYIPPVILPPPTSSVDAPKVTTGKGAVRNTATAVFRTYDITASAPTWDTVTPTWFTDIKMVVMDKSTTTSRAAYVLGNNGTNSRVAYTADIFDTTPVWDLGAIVDGVYTLIDSVPDTEGHVVIYGNTGGTGSSTVYDFTIGQLGWTSAGGGANYSAGVGWTGASYGTGGGVTIRLSFGGTQNLTGIETVHSASGYGGFQKAAFPNVSDNAFGLLTSIPEEFNGSNIVSSWSSSGTNNQTEVVLRLDGAGSTSITVSRVTLTFGDPFGTRYSTTYGSSFAAPQSVGAAVTGGVSSAPRGYVIAAADAQAKISLASGGTYSNAVNGTVTGSYPIAICVPSYRVNSTSLKNTSATPDYLMASPALVSTHSLWRVTPAAKTAITPTVSSTKATASTTRSLDAWRGKTYGYIGDVSGTRYVFVTVNAGTTWRNTAISGAVSIRARRSSSNGQHWIVAANGTVRYSSDGGRTWSSKTATGSNLHAELL